MQPKGIAAFAVALQEENDRDQHGIVEEMKVFFSNNLALNRSVILSAEGFDSDSPFAIKKLHFMLTGFEVTIVYVYRELLSHLISLHFELNRLEHDIRFSEPFSTYLAKNLDTLPRIVDPVQVLEQFESEFGKNAIIVIDLAGCGASGHDVSYVVVCEIAGALCNRDELFVKNSGVQPNSGYTLVNTEIFTFYQYFVEMYGTVRGLSNSSEGGRRCGFCQQRREAWKAFEVYLQEQQHAGKLPLIPIIRTHLTMLVPFAEEVDRKLRANYGNRILHGNATANIQTMRGKVLTEFVDSGALTASMDWRQWMIATYQEDLRRGRLCSCSHVA